MTTRDDHYGVTHKRVCIIGAGVAGLMAVKIFNEFNTYDIHDNNNIRFDVVCYEQLSHLLGTWAYSDRASDYSGMYASMICNTPPEVCQHSDFEFVSDNRYPSMQEFVDYQHRFIKQFNIDKYIKLNHKILRAERLASGEYAVTYKHTRGKPYDIQTYDDDYAIHPVTCHNEHIHTELFDVVVVANGHFTKFNLPQYTGMSYLSPATNVIHSHSYRRATDYTGQHVLVIGGSHSGIDIANQIYPHAASVDILVNKTQHSEQRYNTVCAGIRAKRPDEPCYVDVLHRVADISHVDSSGIIHFVDGTCKHYDTVIAATGYTYTAPFLTRELQVTHNSDNIYKYVFHSDIDDGTLCFIGIPYRSEIQVYWSASVLTGRLHLPSTHSMHAYNRSVQQRVFDTAGVELTPSNAHAYLSQEEYCDDIIRELNNDPHRQFEFAWINWKLIRRPYDRSNGASMVTGGEQAQSQLRTPSPVDTSKVFFYTPIPQAV